MKNNACVKNTVYLCSGDTCDYRTSSKRGVWCDYALKTQVVENTTLRKYEGYDRLVCTCGLAQDSLDTTFYDNTSDNRLETKIEGVSEFTHKLATILKYLHNEVTELKKEIAPKKVKGDYACHYSDNNAFDFGMEKFIEEGAEWLNNYNMKVPPML